VGLCAEHGKTPKDCYAKPPEPKRISRKAAKAQRLEGEESSAKTQRVRSFGLRRLVRRRRSPRLVKLRSVRLTDLNLCVLAALREVLVHPRRLCLRLFGFGSLRAVLLHARPEQQIHNIANVLLVGQTGHAFFRERDERSKMSGQLGE
jgi:hypothetical protein